MVSLLLLWEGAGEYPKAHTLMLPSVFSACGIRDNPTPPYFSAMTSKHQGGRGVRYVTLCYITLRYVTLHYVTLRYITLRYVTLRYVTSRYLEEELEATKIDAR